NGPTASHWSHSTRTIGYFRHNRPLHPTPSPHFLVWYMRQCSHLVPVISILHILFCLLSRQPLRFTASFLWCSPGLCSGTHSLHHVYYSAQLTHSPNVCLSQVPGRPPSLC